MEDCKLPLLAHASYSLKERREHADRKRCVMSMNNPLADNAPTDHEDQALVMSARSGDRQALEELIQRHQGWIYNIAVRMLYHPQDAEDASQEILIFILIPILL